MDPITLGRCLRVDVNKGIGMAGGQQNAAQPAELISQGWTPMNTDFEWVRKTRESLILIAAVAQAYLRRLR